jgi:hypothetical protein
MPAFLMPFPCGSICSLYVSFELFVELLIQHILHLGVMDGLKVMFIRMQGIRATPGHVTNHFFLAAFYLSWSLGNLMNQPHHLANMPVAKPVNIEINADRSAQPFPMRNEGIIAIGFAPGRQEQWLIVT